VVMPVSVISRTCSKVADVFSDTSASRKPAPKKNEYCLELLLDRVTLTWDRSSVPNCVFWVQILLEIFVPAQYSLHVLLADRKQGIPFRGARLAIIQYITGLQLQRSTESQQ